MKSKFVGHLSFALRRPCHNYLRTDWADFFSKFKLLLALGHTPNFFFWISKKQKNKRPWNLAIIGWLWSGLLVSKSSWKWFRVSSRWKQQPMDADEVIRNRGLPVWNFEFKFFHIFFYLACDPMGKQKIQNATLPTNHFWIFLNFS